MCVNHKGNLHHITWSFYTRIDSVRSVSVLSDAVETGDRKMLPKCLFGDTLFKKSRTNQNVPM